MEDVTPVKPGFGGFDEPYDRARVVFLGVPLDVTSSYRPGTRLGPARIREASMNLETYVMPAGLDLLEELSISDLGDLLITPTDLEATGARIRRVVKRVRDDGKIPALLGGEHTLTYFSLGAFDDVFAVQLDAHRDLREEYAGDRLCHSTVMRRVLDRVPPERLVQIGVRSCSKEEAELARDLGIRTYTAELVMSEPSRVAEGVLEAAGDSPVYLTVDLDVFDPAFVPGVTAPEPGGPSTADILKLVRELGKLNLCAFDVVELVPLYDNGISAFAAARTIYELLAALAGSPK